MSFNVAPAELLDQALISRLLAAVEHNGAAPGSLLVEITEDSLLADPDRAVATLKELNRQGIQVAIDDYGSGYSSLASLRDLPVDELKMDRSFVTAAATDPRSRSIVASTCHLARGLGLRTVAEGVEDEQTADVLRDLGVDVLQGYHFARPMPYDQLRSWLKQRPAQRDTHAVSTPADHPQQTHHPETTGAGELSSPTRSETAGTG